MLSLKWSLSLAVFALLSCQPNAEVSEPPFDNSTLVALQPSAPADGQTGASVQLTVRDTTGAIVAGRQIEFVTGADVALVQPYATDKLGQATATLTSTKVHDVVLGARVRLRDGWSVLRQTATVSFYDTKLIPENISLVLTQKSDATLVADGTQSVAFTLSVLDGMGAQVVGAPVTFASSGTGNLWTGSTGETNAMGLMTASLLSTRAEVKTVTAYVGKNTATAQVTFVPGPLDAAHSRFAILPNTLAADGVSQGVVRLTAKDAHDNPLEGAPVTFSSDTETTIISPTNTSTNVRGDAYATAVASVIGETVLMATMGEAAMTLTVPVLPPLASGLFSRLVLPQRTVQADGVSQVPISVKVYDVANRAVPGQWVTMASTDSHDTFLPAAGMTDETGAFASTLTSQFAGAKSIFATFGRVSVGATATFVPLNADYAQSSLTSSPPLITADGNHKAVLLLRAKDINGNAAAYEPLSVTLDDPNASLDVSLGSTDGLGQFVATVTTRKAGPVTARVTLLSTSLSTQLQFVAGTPDLTLSSITVLPNTLVADGVSAAVVQAKFVDGLGNLVRGWPVQFSSSGQGQTFIFSDTVTGSDGMATARLTSTLAQNVAIDASCGASVLTASMRFVAGSPSVSQSSVQVMQAPGRADGLTQVTLRVQVRDAQGNPVPNAQVAFSALDAAATVTPASGTTAADGTLTASVRSTVPVVQRVSIVSGAMGLTAHVPFVTAGPFGPNSAFVSLQPQVQADNVARAAFMFTVRDGVGQPVVGQQVRFDAGSATAQLSATQGRTDGQGTAAVWLTSPLAGVVPVTATADNVAMTARVTFMPGALSVSQSSVAIRGSGVAPQTLLPQVVANGDDVATVTVALKDALGNSLPGQPVAISSADGNDIIASYAAITDANGRFVASVTGTLAGSKTLRITSSGLTLFGPFAMVAGPPVSTHSALVVSPATVLADGTAAATLTASLADVYGNPVVGQPVAFTAGSQAGNVFSNSNLLTNSLGHAVVSLRSLRAETKTIVATAAGLQLDANVAFVPGPISQAQSALTQVSSAPKADGATPIVLQLILKDALGNSIVGQAVRMSSSNATDTALQTSAVTSALGTWSPSFVATQAGSRVVTVVAGAQLLELAVVVAPGAPSAQSTLTVAPSINTTDDDTRAQVRVVLLDALNNPVPDQVVQLTASGQANSFYPAQGTTDARGTFVAEFASRQAALKWVTATATPGGMPQVMLNAPVTFVAGAVNPARSTVTIMPAQAVADGTSQVAITVLARDSQNNPIPALAVRLSSDIASDLFAPSQGVADSSGIWRSYGTFTAAGLRTLQALWPDQAELKTGYRVGAAAVSAVTSTLTSSTGTLIANGAQGAQLTLVLRDDHNNFVPGADVIWSEQSTGLQVSPITTQSDAQGVARAQVTAMSSGAKTVAAAANGLQLSVTLNAVADVVAQDTSVLTAVPETQVADGLAVTTLTLRALDAFGNAAIGQPAAIAVDGLGNVLSPSTGFTDSAGRFSVTLTSTAAGSKTVVATVGPATLRRTVSFVAGAPSLAHSSLTAQPNALVGDGVESAILALVVRDIYDNPIAGAPVSTSYSGPGGALLPGSGQTDSLGQWGTRLTVLTPGQGLVVAQVGSPVALTLSQAIAVLPGMPDAASSSLTLSPNVLLADGSALSRITLSVADKGNHPVPNQSVVLSVTGSDALLTVTSGSTDGNGNFTSDLRSHIAELKSVTARAGPVTLTAPVKFVPGICDIAQSNFALSSNSLIADGSAPLTLQIEARDAFGNAAPGSRVSVQVSGTGNRLSTALCEADAQGRCTITLVSTVAETKTLTATFNEDSNMILSATAYFMPGAPNATLSQLTIDGNAAIADGVATLAVALQVRDVHGNVLPGVPVEFKSEDRTLVFAQNTVMSDAAGIAATTMTSTWVGSHVVMANAGGVARIGAGLFVPGPVSGAHTTLLVAPPTLIADGKSTALLTLLAQDAFGNPVPDASVAFSGQGNQSLFVTAQLKTDATGIARASVSSTSAHTETLQAQVGAATASAQVHFVAGAAQSAYSTLAISPNSLAADGAALATVAVVLRDAQGNPAIGQNVTLSGVGPAALGITPLPQSGVTDSSGAWQTTLSTTVARTAQLRLDAGAAQMTATLTARPGAVDTAHSTLTVVPQAVVADGVSAMWLMGTFADAHGNAVCPNTAVAWQSSDSNDVLAQPISVTSTGGTAAVAVVSTEAGSRTFTATASGVVLQAQGTFLPGAVGDLSSGLTVSPATVVADNASVGRAVLHVTDDNGNAVAGAAVTFTLQDGSTILQTVQASSDGNGDASATFTSTLAKSLMVFARSGPHLISAPITFVPGLPSAHTSTLVLSPNAGLADGRTAVQVSATIKDAYGNVVPASQVLFNVAGGGTVGVTSTRTDNEGHATTEVVSTVARLQEITAAAGTAILQAAVPFLAGDTSAALSLLTAVPNTLVADGNGQSSISVYLQDAYGNPVPGQVLTLSSPDGPLTFDTTSLTTDASGRAQAKVSGVQAGSRRITAHLLQATLSTLVTFVAGPVVPGSVSLIASPNVVLADGLAPANLLLQAFDAQGNAVPQATARFAVTGMQPLTLSATQAITDVTGFTYVTLRSTLAQSAQAHATITTPTGDVTASAPLQFVASVPSSVRSTLTAAPMSQVADGVQAMALGWRLVDAFDNPIAAQSVSVTAPGATCAPASGVTDADGRFACQLTSTQAGPTAVTLQSGGLTRGLAVSFVPGEPTLAGLTLTSATSQLLANNAATVQLSANVADAYGNAVPDVRVAFTGDDADTFVPQMGNTTAIGARQTLFKTTKAGTRVVTATLPDHGVSRSVTLQGLAGVATSAGMVLTGCAGPIVADGVALCTFATTVRDAFDNAVASAPITWTVTGPGNVPAGGLGATDANGLFQQSFGSTAAGAKIYTVVSGAASAQGQATFVAGSPNAARSSFTAQTLPNPADGVAQASFALLLRDSFDNPVAQLPVTFASPGNAGDVLTSASALTDAQGQASTALAATQSGSKTVTASGTFGTWAAQATFVAAGPSLARTSLDCAPGTAVANNLAAITCTLTVQDAYGNSVVAAPVIWTSNSAGAQPTPMQPVTGADGKAVATVVTTQSQTAAITAAVGAISRSAPVTFVPGPVQLGATLLTASPNQAVANGNNAVEAKLFVADAFGNAIANQNVLFASSANDDLLTDATATTNAAGQANVAIRALVAGARMLQATVAGNVLTLPIGFVPGPVSMSRSVLSVSPNQVLADGTTLMRVTVLARDRQLNIIPSSSVVWGTLGAGNLPPSGASVTDGNGLATFDFASTTAELKTITATLGTSGLNTSGLFVAGAPSASTTTFTSSLSPVTADGVAVTRLTVTAKDALGNLVPLAPVSLTVTGSQNTLAQSSGATDAAGVYSTTLSSTRAESKTITATIAQSTSKQLTVLFAPGTATAAASVLQSDRVNVVADGNDRAWLTLTLRDVSGNPVPYASVAVTSLGSAMQLTPTSGSTNAAGIFSVAVKSTAAQNASIALTSGSASLSYNQAFVPGPVAQAQSVLTLNPDSLTADGIAQTTVTVLARDAFGNSVANQNVVLTALGSGNNWTTRAGTTSVLGQLQTTLSSSKAETKAVSAQMGNVMLAGNVVFLHGPPSTVTSTWTASPNTLLADGQATSALSLTVVDVLGNPVAGQSVALTSSGSLNTLTPPTGVTDAQGKLTATFKTTQAAVKVLTAQFANLSMTAQVLATPGTASAAGSSLVVQPGIVTADGGSTAAVVFTLADALGNPLPGQTMTFAQSGTGVTLTPPSGVTDGAGQLRATASSSVAQAIDLNAVTAGLTSSAALSFVPGPVSAVTSTLVQSPGGALLADGVAAAQIALKVQDAQGNAVANQPVTLTATAPAQVVPQSGVTDSTGTLSLSLTSTQSGSKTITATLGTSPGAPVITLPVAFVAGAPSVANSRITLSPSSLAADGVTPTSLTVTCVDTLGNVVPNAPVALTATGTANVFAPTTGTANAQGLFTATLTSERAQTETVSAAMGAGGTAVVSAPVTFVPGAVSAAASSLTLSPNQAVANGVNFVAATLVLRDAKGNAVPNTAASFTSSNGNDVFSSTGGTTDAAGTITTQLRATVAQNKTVTALFGAASLVAQATFMPGPPVAVTSGLGAAPASVLADGNAQTTLSLVAADAFGNRIPGLFVTLSGSGASNQFAQASGTTSATGTWSTTLSSTLAQSETITAILGSTAPASVTTLVTFTPGQPVLATSSLVAAPNPFVANAVATSALTVTARDLFNNVVPNQNVVMAFSGSNRATSSLTGKTDASGRFTATVSTPLPQLFTVSANVAGAFALSANTTAIPGPTAYFTLAGVAGGLSAATSSPQVLAFDALGNATPAYRGTVAFSSSDGNAGLPADYTFTASDAGARTFPSGVTLVSAGQQTVTVKDVANTTITGSQGPLTVTAPIKTQLAFLSRAGLTQCLDLKNGATTDGTPMVSSPCNNTAHQLFAYGTDNTLQVLGRCMEVAGANYAAGSPLQAASCTGRTQQRFILNSTGALVAAGNGGLCVDMGAATANTPAVLMACDAASLSQKFITQPLSSRYTIINAALNQVLEVTGSAYVVGTAVQNKTFINAANQAFTYDANNALSVNGLCVQPVGGAVSPGVTLALAACTGSAVQAFNFSGTALISGSDPSYCVDMGTSATSAAATLKPCSASAGQVLTTSVASQLYRYVAQNGTTNPLCLESTNASVAHLTPVISNVCGLNLGQSWSLYPGATQNTQFMTQCLDTSPGLLQVLGLSTYAGQALFANNCIALSYGQVWATGFIPGDSVQLRWMAGTQYCASGRSTAGQQIMLANCSTADNAQRFYQLARSMALSPTATPALCVGATGGLPVPAASLQFSACSSQALGQGFMLQADGSLTYSGLCVDVPAGLTAGNALSLSACSGNSVAQKWQLKAPNGGQNGGVLSSLTNPALCIDMASATPGGAVKIAACSGLATQTVTVR